MASSHPLSFQIDKATEVLEAFDSISYDKGASVLAMLSAVIGEKTFKKAVTVSFILALKLHYVVFIYCAVIKLKLRTHVPTSDLCVRCLIIKHL